MGALPTLIRVGSLQFFSTTIGNSAVAERYCVKRKWNLETVSHLENKIAEKIAITEKIVTKKINFVLYGYGRSLSRSKTY